jgi:hypothetical protein
MTARQGDEACASVLPTLPNHDTDCDRVLGVLLVAYPNAAYHINSSLNCTAHSRVSELRTRYGWDIECVRQRTPLAQKKIKHGYRLLTPPEHWPAGAADSRARVNRKGQVVA